MLLNIIVIVLRETLEASVLISLLLAIGQRSRLGLAWLLPALALGFVGAAIYAWNLRAISEWFDYVGQEVVNAALQYSIYICLLVVCAWRDKLSAVWLLVLMSLTVVLAITHEGGELVVFYSGFLQAGEPWLNAATSGFIGLAIGLSVGVLCFYLLATIKPAVAVGNILLCLVAAGMALQATQLLIQADWLSAAQPVWNSNPLLAESSTAGQLAYAVFGYEATPSLPEVSAYLAALLLIVIFAGKRLLGR